MKKAVIIIVVFLLISSFALIPGSREEGLDGVEFDTDIDGDDAGLIEENSLASDAGDIRFANQAPRQEVQSIKREFELAEPLNPVYASKNTPGFLTLDESFFLDDEEVGPPKPSYKQMNVEPGELPPGAILIGSQSDMEAAARIVASLALAYDAAPASLLKDATKKQQLDQYVNNAKHVFLFKDYQTVLSLTSAWANNLFQIGGIKTSGSCNPAFCEPPLWYPHNQGVYHEGQNEYTVPVALKSVLEQKLIAKAVAVKFGTSTQVMYSAYHFVYELATLYAVDLAYRAALDKNPTVIERVIKAAISAGVVAVAGLSTGPLGALGAAAADISRSVVSNVKKQLQQSDDEKVIENKVAARFSAFRKSNKWESFLSENGYEFTSKIMQGVVKTFPANLWSQSATHQSVATLGVEIEQGTYPGCGLQMYLANSTARFKVALDPKDYVQADYWTDPIKRRREGSLRVAKSGT